MSNRSVKGKSKKATNSSRSSNSDGISAEVREHRKMDLPSWMDAKNDSKFSFRDEDDDEENGNDDNDSNTKQSSASATATATESQPLLFGTGNFSLLDQPNAQSQSQLPRDVENRGGLFWSQDNNNNNKNNTKKKHYGSHANNDNDNTTNNDSDDNDNDDDRTHGSKSTHQSSSKRSNKSNNNNKKRNHKTRGGLGLFARSSATASSPPPTAADDDAASASSSLTGTVTAAGRPHVPPQNPCLWMFHFINGTTILAILCLLLTQVIPMFNDSFGAESSATGGGGNHSAGGHASPSPKLHSFFGFLNMILRGYISLFCIVFVLVEADLPIGVLRKSALLQSYFSRGFLYSFLGLVSTVEASSDRVQSLLSDLTTAQITWSAIFMEVSAWVMCAVGLLYMVMGLCCLQGVRDRMRAKEQEAWKNYREQFKQWKRTNPQHARS